MIPESPSPLNDTWPTSNPTQTYHEIIPTEIVVAVHPELRTDPLELQRAAENHARWLPLALDHEIKQQKGTSTSGMVVSSRFMQLPQYVERELASTLRDRARSVLSKTDVVGEGRSDESAHRPRRVSLGTEPMMDILFDTSDSDRHLRPTAYVAYRQHVPWFHSRWEELSGEEIDLGILVRAW